MFIHHDQVGFIPVMQDCLLQHSKISQCNLPYYIYRVKKKKKKSHKAHSPHSLHIEYNFIKSPTGFLPHKLIS